MDLAAKLAELATKAEQYQGTLLTEQAAKMALVMPFITMLGYDASNPLEVIPEYGADTPGRNAKKVDYAISVAGKLSILIECKPVSSGLGKKEASQLFHYFSVTAARLAILTNGIVYKFYSDLDKPNIMDDDPFFTLDLSERGRQIDTTIIERFLKTNFNTDAIIERASVLKTESLVRQALEREMDQASDGFIRLIAGQVHKGSVTAQIKEKFAGLISRSWSDIIEDRVQQRLTDALRPRDPKPEPEAVAVKPEGPTEEEMNGFRIVQAIAARLVDPKRVVIGNAQSYCAILLDGKTSRTLARLHFKSMTTKRIGTIEAVGQGQKETPHPIADLTDIYKFTPLIEARIREIDGIETDTPAAVGEPEKAKSNGQWLSDYMSFQGANADSEKEEIAASG